MLDSLCEIGEILSKLIGRKYFDFPSKADNERVVNVAHFSWQTVSYYDFSHSGIPENSCSLNFSINPLALSFT